jgi:16S rRNA C967 or C1407 C5-methylase (RsmB/RsmF family)
MADLRKNISDRMADQDKVLDAACAYVRPGGELAYVTCSLLPEENTDRVKAFLQRHPEFETISLKQRWRSVVADSEAPVPYAEQNLGLLLSPDAPEPTDSILPASGGSPRDCRTRADSLKGSERER